MSVKCVLLLVFLSTGCWCQDDEGPYRGQLIGKLNSYHHQTTGDVYAVDEWTLLLVNFNYDGMGDDTFFWAGDSGRPGPQGFIVPDEHGKTNILERYLDSEIRLTLPEGKRISRIKWFAIYDISSQQAFADVFVPEDVDAPRARTLPPLAGTSAVTSGPVKILDARTILISNLKYDGSGSAVYFTAGVGAQPHAKGFKIPDEYGYIEPLSKYTGQDVTLQLPGDSTVLDIGWVSLYDVTEKRSLAAVLMREQGAVPPANSVLHNYKSTLPSCRQLHRNIQVSWDVFGEQLTLEIAALMDEKDYVAFGISGSTERSVMLGADVAVARYDVATQRGHVTDYNITAQAPCTQVLGMWRGVCRDTALGALDSLQLLSASRDTGLSVFSFRRQLRASEPIDLDWSLDRAMYVVWASGPLFDSGEPAYHTIWHRNDVSITLNKQTHENDCTPFNIGPAAPGAGAGGGAGGGAGAGAGWERARVGGAGRSWRAALGPAGGRRAARDRAAPARVFYIDGLMTPTLTLTRGLLYEIQVLGGNDPHSATVYHPLVVETLQGRPLAGYAASRRNRLEPTAAGSLCEASLPETMDPRRVDSLASFRALNRSLVWHCPSPPAAPATLALAPANDWPDTVRYKSHSHPGMGGLIYVVDRQKRSARRSSAGNLQSHTVVLGTAILALLHL